MKKQLIPMLVALALAACSDSPRTSSASEVQAAQQEASGREGVQRVGFPAVVNFTEMKTLKRVYELRDDPKLQTYTYIVNRMTGKLVFQGRTVGYGIPSTTQFTAPHTPEYHTGEYGGGNLMVDQRDPNGLYSGDTHATWVLMQNPANPDEIKPCYFEEDIVVLPFPADPKRVQSE